MRSKTRLLSLFLIIGWLITGIGLCLRMTGNFFVILAAVGVVAYGLGSITYALSDEKHETALARLKGRLLSRTQLLVAVIIVIASFAFEIACLVLHLIWPRSLDVVGVNGVSTTCQLSTKSELLGPSGDIAVVQEAGCPGVMAQGIMYYTIFVHKRTTPNRRSNLVFQYTPGFSHYPPSPPSTSWSKRSNLEITARDVYYIVVQQKNVGQIRITYNLELSSIGRLRDKH